MAMIRGKCKWAKVLEARPADGYMTKDPKEQLWTLDVVVDDAGKKTLTAEGLTKKIKTDKEGDSIIKFKRKVWKRDGDKAKPIEIVDQYGEPWNQKTLIGNGSTVNVMYAVQDYGNGPSASIIKMQVSELVPYEGGEFEEFTYAPKPVEDWSEGEAAE